MLEFRPHHFLCTLGFEGKGYSEDFVRGYREIAEKLRAPDGSGENTPIRVAVATDSICVPCPNRREQACATEDKIQRLDRGHAGVLGLSAGQVLSWAEAKQKLAERMTDAEFERVCAPCSWKALGLCKSALQKLRQPSVALLLACVAWTLLGSLAPTPSHAALVRESHGDHAEEDAASHLMPFETVRAGLLKKHKSKQAHSLKLAWEALGQRKYPQAISLASRVANDPVFGDYGCWIEASARYGEGIKALTAKNYAEAVRDAEASIVSSLKIDAKSPYSPMLKNLHRDVGLAEILEADAYAAQKKWKPAERFFEQGLQRLSTGNSMGLVRPESLHHYAQACAVTKTEMCDAWILRFSFFYPRNSEEMRAIVQVLPQAQDHPRPAPVSKLTQSYKAPDLDQAAFEVDIALYLDGKFGAAIKGFQQFIDEYPKSPFRFRARYWLAQAMTQQQQHDKAQQAYETLQHDSPLTYYGLLAALAAGHDMDAPIDQTVPLVAERDPLLHAPELLRLERAELFTAEGATDLAAMELKEFRSRDALSSPFLMYLAALATEARTYNTAFGILSDLVARGYEGATSADFLAMVFPLEHLDEIRKQSAANEIDPVLVLSLIKQESAFEKSAISSTGALGLMQLMPATATDTDPSVDRADLVEPSANVRVGTKYLKHLLTRFNGNIVLALAGYNAGPNAADRWFRDQGSKRGMLDFIETIPYKETREYVAAIIRNYYWYSRKLTPDVPAKPLSFFWSAYNPSGTPSSEPSAQPPQDLPAPAPSPEPTRTPVPLLPVDE